MAWETSSEWGSSDSTGLTDAQKRMDKSMYPGAAQPSEPTPKAEGKVTTGAGRAAEEQTTEQKDQAKQEAEAKSQASQQLNQQVNQISSRIGAFGYLLKNKMNQFLTQSTASGVGAGTAATTFDANGMKIVDSVTSSIDPAIQEKQALQAGLKTTLSPFAQEVAGKLQGKTFDKALQDLAATDPGLAQSLPQVLQINSLLDQLEAQGKSGSPEAQSLMDQLRRMDSTGMVSGLRRAKEQYEQLMGLSEKPLTYSGDSTKKYTSLDLASLGSKELADEVEKGIKVGSGIFGGDTNENLQRLYDTESAEITNANRQKEALHGQLTTALTDYAAERGQEFGAAREQITQMFTDAGDSIVKALEASGDGQAAKLWAEASRGGNMQKFIMDALNDPKSGLAKEQRQAIMNFIGEAGATGGELNSWLNSLRTTGKISVKQSDGNYVPVELSPGQTAQMLSVMNDPSIEDKEAAIRPIIERSVFVDSNGQSTTIGGLVQNAVTTATTMGNTPEAVKGFQASMVNSLMTYAKSQTEDISRKAMGIDDATWKGMTPEQRTAAVAEAFRTNPDLVKNFRENVQIKADADAKVAKQAIDDFNAKYAAANAKRDKLATFDAQGNLAGGEYMTQIQTLDNTLPSMAGQITQQFKTAFSNPYRYNQYYESLGKNAAFMNSHLDRSIAAKALMYYEGAKYTSRYSPELVEAIYGGANLGLTIDPRTLIANGDIAGLTALVKETEAAYAANAKGLPEAVMTSLQRDSKTGTSEFARTIQSKLQEADALKKKLLGQVELAKKNKLDLDAAKETMDILAKQQSGHLFNIDEIINVAMGGARVKESTGKQDVTRVIADNLGVPPESIVTDAQGVPYVKMGDGSYRPISQQDIVAAMGTLSTQGDSGMAGQWNTGLGINYGGDNPNVETIGAKAAPVVKAPPRESVAPNKSGGFERTPSGAHDSGDRTYVVTDREGKERTINIPAGADEHDYLGDNDWKVTQVTPLDKAGEQLGGYLDAAGNWIKGAVDAAGNLIPSPEQAADKVIELITPRDRTPSKN